MKGRVAKYYLTDGRRHTDSEGYKTSVAFEKYLADCGLQVATDRDFGITALRWWTKRLSRPNGNVWLIMPMRCWL